MTRYSLNLSQVLDTLVKKQTIKFINSIGAICSEVGLSRTHLMVGFSDVD